MLSPTIIPPGSACATHRSAPTSNVKRMWRLRARRLAAWCCCACMTARVAAATISPGPKLEAATRRSAIIIVPRKNGKTTMLAAYALYRLFNDETQPEILLAAASDKQAGRLFDTCVQFIRRSPLLSDGVALREYVGEISRSDGGGKILRMASSADNLHGYSPSLVVADEVHAWTKPSQRKAWAALTTAGGARKSTQVFSITTAGDANGRESSILGRMLDRNEAVGELEKHDGLTISRNHDARTLIYNYAAPTKDPMDTAAMKLEPGVVDHGGVSRPAGK